MPRPGRLCPPGVPQHIIQRGNNRQAIFGGRGDFAFFSGLLKRYSEEHAVAIHAWALMTNHVHLLVTPSDETGVSDFMQSIGRRYVRFFNRRHDRTGGLWEGRFRSCVIDSENYLLSCQRYIELNPVKAGMVKNPEDYWWTSYQCHALGQQNPMHQPHEVYQSLAKSPSERKRRYRQLFNLPLPEDVEDRIRKSIKNGKPLGDEAFRRKFGEE
ncbi:transposase [Marinobacter sp. C2H3]|uniref:transposase n=1 Tax=Marinobacter sp. C2H3 TaxID=3119003 RepID=UPI00300E7AB3